MRGKFDDAWPLILITGAFISGLLVGKLQYTQKWLPGWEMVSGLGTFAAAAIALWLAGKDNHLRHEEADARMRLTAARLYLPFAEASRRLGYIAVIARETGHTIDSHEQYQLLLDELRRVNLSITNEDLLALAPLPNRAGYLLSGAMGNISIAIGTFESSENMFRFAKNLVGRPGVMMRIGDLATEASHQLDKVAIECQKASIAQTSPHH